MKVPIIGEKYLMRRFPNLGLSDLHKVKVTDVVTLGDGTVIVRYKNISLFSDVEDMELSEFLDNTEVNEIHHDLPPASKTEVIRKGP